MTEQQQHQGTPIAFGDIREGDRIRAFHVRKGAIFSVEGTVVAAIQRESQCVCVGESVEESVALYPSDDQFLLLSRPPYWRKLASPREADVGKLYQVELRGGYMSSMTGRLTCWVYDSATNIHTLTIGGREVPLLDVVAMYEEVSP